MSSYELLELFGAHIVYDTKAKTRTIHVDFAPENGAWARALRGGERSEVEQMSAQSANSLAVLTAAFVPGAHTDQYNARMFYPVAKQREFEAEHHRVEAEKQRIQTEGAPAGGMAAMWHVKEEVS